ncbi:type VI secretion system tip protein TssI/VgrG [Polyangium aurulentum]|uniref:type VI secretion system tip protein TssI/VgrG n=1 Tax=Polyangium aurulentum TaxID=2567896 RepID=UPI0010ADA732|nr:type VI secretion system tip protein TssI/VgrG [Polyangium aurulentum]UQA56367.1 type VI secretion system tip protein VgrG [Polyangium aurulentum]
MPSLELSFASKEDSLSVRHFAIREEISGLFEVDVLARSPLEEIDLEGLVDNGAGFGIHGGGAFFSGRVWTGICSHMELVQAEPSGLSTYFIKIVPALWRTTLRRNHRIFQHMTIPAIVGKVLGEWQIEPELRLTAEYPAHEFKVQYGETDFAFISRLLEEAGITYHFTHEPPRTVLVLSDEPTAPGPRPALPYVDNPNDEGETDYVTKVKLAQRVKPGRFTLRDFDFRNQLDYQLFAEARAGTELAYEQYLYDPGAFWVEPGQGGDTPVADDKGVARASAKEANARAARELDGARRTRRVISFQTNVVDLSPGTLMTVDPHPRADIAGKKLLVIHSTIEGAHDTKWTMTGEAVYADAPYRPERRTPRPRVHGVQSAVVVGPPGEEIHVDEFGRVRVQFHWDREGSYDDGSSCWIRVSQGWAGAGYGFLNLPRVGQEVLVEFFEGDPDRPVITGRVFSYTRRTLYNLPENKTKSGWKSESSPGAGGFNELSFEDAAGREEIHIQAQKDFTEIVKNNQSSTVLNNRSASVTSNDSMTVGQNQSFSVGGNQSHTIGEVQSIDIGESRTSNIGKVDSVDVGEVLTGTVGALGVGFVYTQDQFVLFTNSVASIVLSEEGLFINSKADIHIHADGVLKLSGKDVLVDGKPNVFFNRESKRLRLLRRLALIQAARDKAENMPPGPERDALLAAANRLAASNEAVELARLSADVYNPSGAPEGWERLDHWEYPSGFYAAAYRSRIDGSVVVAYRGTEPGTLGDWTANLRQGGGWHSEQHAQAAMVARQAQARYGDNLRFTGHSLGGGHAGVGSTATGRPATTFNAAGINPESNRLYGLNPAHARQVNNYTVDGDILTSLQRGIGPMPDAIGTQRRLPAVQMNTDSYGNTVLDQNGQPTFSPAPPFDPNSLLQIIGESIDRHSRYVDGLEFLKAQDTQTIQRMLG